MTQLNRFDLMRERGAPALRVDGTKPDRETDRQARAAEEAVARGLGGIVAPVTDKPDAGYDVLVNGWRIGVQWTRHVPPCHLVYHQRVRMDTADIYVLACGTAEIGFRFGCWTTAEKLRRAPLKALDPEAPPAPSLRTTDANAHDRASLDSLLSFPGPAA